MKKIRNIKIFRTIIQIISFIVFPGLISLVFLSLKASIVDLWIGNYTTLFSDSLIFILITFLTMIFGRFFCGFICIFGSYNDWINIIGKKVFKINYKVNKTVDKYLKYIKYIILIFLIFFVWSSAINIPSGINPWDTYMQLYNLPLILSSYMIGLVLLIIITIGNLFIERFFCRYFCPLGATFSLFSRMRIIRIYKPKTNCGPCKACSLKCSMGIDLNDTEEVNSGECIQCFNCVSICPKNNAKVRISNKVINEYVISLVALGVIGGSYYGSTKINLDNSTDNSIISNTSTNTNIDNQTTIDNTNDTTTTITSSAKYIDGTYTGTGTGYRPNLKLSVTIKDDQIVSIEVVSNNETSNFFSRAWSKIKSAILSSQTTNVDTVSGATRSSNGIIEAVNDALSKASISN